jgi:hypothetical protein
VPDDRNPIFILQCRASVFDRAALEFKYAKFKLEFVRFKLECGAFKLEFARLKLEGGNSIFDSPNSNLNSAGLNLNAPCSIFRTASLSLRKKMSRVCEHPPGSSMLRDSEARRVARASRVLAMASRHRELLL